MTQILLDQSVVESWKDAILNSTPFPFTYKTQEAWREARISIVDALAAKPEPAKGLPLTLMTYDDGRTGWYIDHPEFYCDIDCVEGRWSVFVRDRKGSEGFSELAKQDYHANAQRLAELAAKIDAVLATSGDIPADRDVMQAAEAALVRLGHVTTKQKLLNLIGDYWDISYQEGLSGQPCGDEANECLCAIQELVNSWGAPPTMTLDGQPPMQFVLNELSEFQEATNCAAQCESPETVIKNLVDSLSAEIPCGNATQTNPDYTAALKAIVDANGWLQRNKKVSTQK